MSTTSDGYIDDSSESIMSTEDPSQVPHPESNDSDDEDDDDNGTESTEANFWSLLIEETAEKIHNDRLGAGLPGPIQEISNLNQLVHGKWLSLIIKHLQNRYREIKEISDAATDDTLLGMIGTKADKVVSEYEPANEDIAKEANAIAWKKYKLLVRKKIIDNLEQFQVLVGGEPDSDSDEVASETSDYLIRF